MNGIRFESKGKKQRPRVAQPYFFSNLCIHYSRLGLIPATSLAFVLFGLRAKGLDKDFLWESYGLRTQS